MEPGGPVGQGANLGSAGAALAVQQLVFTATAALQSDDPVRILIEGQPVEELFGPSPSPIRSAERSRRRYA